MATEGDGKRKGPKKLNASGLLDYALKVLSVRGLSQSELRQRLQRRAESPDDIPTVIARLKEYGYLNDRAFAELFASSRLANRGEGKIRVLRDLQNRRVAPKLAEEVVSQTFRDVDEVQLVEQYLARKMRTVDLPTHLSDEKNLAAVYRRLRRAGFRHGTCLSVLLRYAKSAETLEGLEAAAEE